MIAEVLNKIPVALIQHTPQKDVIAPSFVELSDLARVDDIEQRVLVIRDGEHIAACALCYIEQRRHHGVTLSIYELFGYLLHDYSRIYAESEEALSMLINLAIRDAKSQNCDLIYWSNIPKEFAPGDKRLIPKTEIKIFSALEKEDGWKSLYDRKSVKQSRRMAARAGEYRVEVIDGLVPNDIMRQMSQFHIERWQFSGSTSPFKLNPKRTEEYITHPENKHYLRIMVGNDVLASHYGMKYGKTLLLHTPIINPKYLKESPMRLLIAETAKYCEEKGLDAIDFGHGDEAYKDGYCTLPRHTYSFVRPISIKGQLAEWIGKSEKCGLKEKLFSLMNIARQDSKPACKRFMYQGKDDTIVNDSRLSIIKTWWEFYDFCRDRKYPMDMECYKRFLHDKSAMFFAIADETNVYAACWSTQKTETNNLGEATFIYDFNVADNADIQRDIKILISACKNEFENIFAIAGNKTVCVSLLQAGFVQSKNI